MAGVTVTSHLLSDFGADRNRLESRRVRTTGTRYYSAETNVADNNTTVTLWSTGDGGLGTFDFGEFQIDQNADLDDGADDAELILELASATYTIALRCHREVPMRIPDQITDDVDGALENVSQIRVKNTNADGDGDLRCKLVLFGRSA